MNKYKEALDTMKETIQEIDMRTDVCTNVEVGKVIQASIKLQELVDKATPKKGVNLKKFDSFISPANCPTCDTYLYEQFAHCPDCGQAIDWEE